MPKRNGLVDSLIGGYHMYDEICEAIKKDADLKNMLQQSMVPSCYPDPELKTLTIDVGFYLACYSSERTQDRARRGRVVP